MHKSPTRAYDMGQKYNTWFSSRFGFDVVFAYLGGNRRKVLGSLAPNAPVHQQKQNGTTSGGIKGWMSTITKSFPFLNGAQSPAQDDEFITFADCAACLVVTEESLADISKRLPEGEEMDITKFRPNIVVASSNKRWDEDLWGEIALGPSSTEPYAKTILASNCPRCISINIDFATGKPGEGATGEVLKQMQRDRRADKGSKYSPIFGRYGFLVREGGSVVGDGREIKVGDEVAVTRRNGERTTFGWPGLGTPAKEEMEEN